MYDKRRDQLLLNYGWKHSWCDPSFLKNFYIKEIVRGPLARPNLACTAPYVTLCQHDGSAIRLRDGIPDCWAEYLIPLLRLLQYYEFMHREDADIAPQLRKYYRLYLGQGIPNPWPYNDDIDIFPPERLENLRRYSHRSSQCTPFKTKEHCACCTKRYLFKCPDTCDTDSCCSLKNHPCKYIPVVSCSRKCRHSKELPKEANLKHKRKKPSKESSESCPSSPTESSSVCGNICEIKSHNHRNKFPKEQPKKCSCPIIKNFCLKSTQKYLKDNCAPKPVFVSKLIQVEVEPAKKSKSVQTDYPRYQCYTKCYWCNVLQTNSPWKTSCKQGNPAGGCEVGYPPICSAPSFCFPAICPQNPAFVCPYTFSNHFMNYKPLKEKSIGVQKQSNKKHLKEKESEDIFNPDRSNLKQLKAKEASERSVRWDNTEQEVLKPHVSKNEKTIYSCSKSTKPIDHAKYLTDDKLKYYLQRENFITTQNKFINHTPNCGFKPTNFDDENKTFYNPNRIQLERFKTFSRTTPELFVDKKTSPRESNG